MSAQPDFPPQCPTPGCAGRIIRNLRLHGVILRPCGHTLFFTAHCPTEEAALALSIHHPQLPQHAANIAWSLMPELWTN